MVTGMTTLGMDMGTVTMLGMVMGTVTMLGMVMGTVAMLLAERPAALDPAVVAGLTVVGRPGRGLRFSG
jgi:hypothetical protein